jgi:hypothetical protein
VGFEHGLLAVKQKHPALVRTEKKPLGVGLVLEQDAGDLDAFAHCGWKM